MRAHAAASGMSVSSMLWPPAGGSPPLQVTLSGSVADTVCLRCRFCRRSAGVDCRRLGPGDGVDRRWRGPCRCRHAIKLEQRRRQLLLRRRVVDHGEQFVDHDGDVRPVLTLTATLMSSSCDRIDAKPLPPLPWLATLPRWRRGVRAPQSPPARSAGRDIWTDADAASPALGHTAVLSPTAWRRRAAPC